MVSNIFIVKRPMNKTDKPFMIHSSFLFLAVTSITFYLPEQIILKKNIPLGTINPRPYGNSLLHNLGQNASKKCSIKLPFPCNKLNFIVTFHC